MFQIEIYEKIDRNITKEVAKETVRLLKDRQVFNYLKLNAAA